jgi:hypothetical protein
MSQDESLVARALQSNLGSDLAPLFALASEMPRAPPCAAQLELQERLQQLRELEEELLTQYPHGLPVGGMCCCCAQAALGLKQQELDERCCSLGRWLLQDRAAEVCASRAAQKAADMSPPPLPPRHRSASSCS